jgi:hypothetical protein
MKVIRRPLVGVALAWVGWKSFTFNRFLNKHYELDDFDLYLAKLRPGLVVAKPTVTHREYEVVFGPPPRFMNLQVEKEWTWEKPKMTLRVKRRSYDKESQVDLKIEPYQ